MAGYVIALVDVTDPEGYAVYRDMVPSTIEQYGGKYLARGGRYETLEGQQACSRLALIEFESYERALQWWGSPEYEAAKPHRRKSSTASIVLVEGLAPPS